MHYHYHNKTVAVSQHKERMDDQIILSCQHLTLSLPESNLESINVALTFESVDETLVCDHSNETELLSSTVAVLFVFDNFAK